MNNTNVYASLLKAIWEDRVKTCHSYVQFGCRYHQKMRFLMGKEADEYTLFCNSHHQEYYKLPQWTLMATSNLWSCKQLKIQVEQDL
jgi:hypothetical protein